MSVFNEAFLEYYGENLGKGKFRKVTCQTPKGNGVKAHLCMEQNRYLGSLMIFEVNGHPTRQIVHGFPKMGYYEGQNVEGDYYVAEKIDGTNVVIYPLLDHDGLFLEAVPKTRRTVVMGEYGDRHFYNLYQMLKDKEALEDHVKLTGGTLALELYGYLNKHSINYSEPIDYCLLARWDSDNHPTFIDGLKQFNHAPRVEYTSDVRIFEALDKLMDEYEAINNNDGVLKHEGVVLTSMRDGDWKFYKAKPASVYQSCVCSEGVPTGAVKHSVAKYFDEHYDCAKENYESDREGVVNEVKDDLEGDFPRRYVDEAKTVRKIINVFEARIAEREYDESLVEIAECLVADNPDLCLSDLMRVFAEKYPYLKKKSSDVYNIIKKKYGGVG